MATVLHGSLTPINDSNDVSWICEWTPLTSANAVGDSLSMTAWSDRSVQISGTFDSATVVIQGSNDGDNWVTLTDPQGNAISKTSAAIEQISEITRYIRPSTSGGGGTQSVTVTLLVSGYRRW